MKKKSLFFVLTGILASTCLIYNTWAAPLDYCPNQDKYHILVNKQNLLSSEYVPENLVMPNVKFNTPGDIDKNYMEKEAANALEIMFNEAKKEGIILIAVSGYRSYSYQNNLYTRAVNTYGKNQIGTAKPNESEHRTGLAMDVTGTHGGTIEESFANTPEGKWIANNSYKYGFIIRYPKGKTDITGYIYEPWHVRYVGKEYAKALYESGLTMEEFNNCCYKKFETIMEVNKKYDDQKISVIKDNGKLYVGLRELGNRMNGKVEYNATTHVSSLTVKNKTIWVKKNSINNTYYKTLTIDDRIYIPLRESCDLLGYRIVEILPDISRISLIKK